MKTIIALDVGTSSTRAVVYGDDGTHLFTSGHEYHSLYPQPLQVEQDPRSWSTAADDVLGQAAAHLRREGLRPEGIAVTSQRASLIPLDGAGQPLRHAIMWQDKRTIGDCQELMDICGLEYLYRKTGLRVNPVFVLPKLRWLRANEPEIFAAGAKFLGVQDYVVHHLTGEYKTDWTQASRTLLLDLRTFRWDPELLELAGIGPERLCELVPPGAIAGGLRPALADRTGLPAGLPVVIAGGDQQNAAMGLGVVRPGVAEANTGTGSFVLSYSDKPVFEPECRVLCQASAMAGKWMVEAGIFNTGAIFRWFKERFCPDYCGLEDAYDRMTAEAAGSPAGANGVVMLPHFEGSLAPNWNPAAKGLFFNLSLKATRADMMRSILDGIALEIRENMAMIQKLTTPIVAVSVAGGMVRSDLFCQVQASAYNRQVIRYDNSEASSLGACMVAAPALGLHRSLEAAFDAMSCASHVTIQPDAGETEVYDRLARSRGVLYRALHEMGVYTEFL
ncbi:MAG: carbohydrate kinase [Planctomycetes bacterium]|nr:carbohydrate kinase [Planctomycetota bacterium]